MSGPGNAPRDPIGTVMASAAPATLVAPQSTASMIDSRNVYKISPVQTTAAGATSRQDIVKIRITKEESGKGLGYTKSIISSSAAQPPEDKSDTVTSPSPSKLSINLAQQPTLQLKTSQNKIVLVKMLPKLPQSGPQVVPVATPRSSLSPTTLALARGVQGLRPHPPSATATVATRTPEKKDTPLKATESSLSISPATTLTLSTSGVPSELNISSESNEQDTSQAHEVKLNETPADPDQNGAGVAVAAASSVKMSREMKTLKASQSSSKVLSEFVQDISTGEKLRKRRRSRGGDGEDSRSCGSVTPVSMKRGSISGHDEDEPMDDGKDGSGCSSAKRSGMRSANAEFSMKQRKFLSSIHQNSDGSDNSEDESSHQQTSGAPLSVPSEVKKEGTVAHVPTARKPGWDKYCWRCKTSEPGLEPCTGCIRCYHPACVKLNPAFFVIEKKWNCSECVKLNQPGELNKDEGGKPAKDSLGQDSLTVSLKFAMKRMQMLKGSSLLNPLDKDQFVNYDQYVTNHVDLAILQTNVMSQKYRTTDAFIADVNWILHNASIYPHNSKLLPVAKAVVKVCKQEMNEIEACNECYFNANTCKMWFTEVCSKPHLLVWAKLKGFPFWPAKLMSVNSNQLVDVRFFGDHDRAWVPIKECMLFCEKDPNTKQQRRSTMAECMREADTYIGKLKRKFGQFQYSEFRTPVEANKLDEHLEAMIPGVLKKMVESDDSQKSKLMLKIIKTADNFLSVSPIGNSTTAKASTNVVTSAETITTDEFEEPRVPDRSTTENDKARNESASAPELMGCPAPTRKRKNSSQSEDLKAENTLGAQTSMIRRRSSRVSTAMSKLRDDSGRNSVTPDAPKKHRDESPALEGPKQDKVESMVILRKSDSWKTMPAAKKPKTTSKSSEDLSATSTTPADPKPIATVVTQKYVIVEKTPPETVAKPPPEVALLPLAPTEIKTEITVEEPPVEASTATVQEPPPVVEDPPVVPNRTEPATMPTSNPPEETPAPVPQQQLLPIKLEPLSDDDNDDNVPSAGQNDPTPSQMLIRTNNRIMVKDINKLTNQMGAARTNVNPPVVEIPKIVPQKVTPKAPPAVPVKVRRVFPSQLPQQLTANPNPNKPVQVAPGGIPVPPQRNGNNMMHMVHIPNPLPTSNSVAVDAPTRMEAINGGQPTAQQPPIRQQPTTNCDSTSQQSTVLPAATTTTTTTEGAPPATNVPSTAAPIAGPSSSAPPPPPDASTEGQHMMSGFITPSLAAAVTETIVAVPPKLQSRPSGAIRSEGDCVYPSGAGPVSQILINNSYKMADFFRSVIEDTLADLSNNSGALESKVKLLELEIEKLKHCHQQEIAKLKHNSDLVLCEMRKNMELERTRIINEVRKQCELERIRSVEEAKRKQWCVNCGKEALFYCCWNTSYCDYPCQQQHWGAHMSQCTQSQLNLPSAAIASKPAGKVAPQHQQQQHITTPKITTVQTLNMNGRSGLTIQPTQQQQQQLIISSARGGAQLGKGQAFQRMMPSTIGTNSTNTVPYAPAGSRWPTVTTASLSTMASGPSSEQASSGPGRSSASSRFVVGLK